MSGEERMLCIIGVVIVAIILALSFQAYFSPAMLFDFANLRLCT